MLGLKHIGQMHKTSDIEKDAKPEAGCDPSEALAGLCQALESEAGSALLTGPAGVGKSELVQELVPHLTCMVCRVTISDEEMTDQDFRQFLAKALGLEVNVQSRGAFLMKIREFLMSEAVKDNRIVFVLESIQCLNKKLFKELELLSDIRIHNRFAITFLFVGLTEAESIFDDPNLAQITDRIYAKIRLKDASSDDASSDDASSDDASSDDASSDDAGSDDAGSDDVSDFNDVRLHIRDYLQNAGALENMFDAGAVREVYRMSQGRLWAVEGLCDLALLIGALYGLKKIPATVVRENARLLGLPVKSADGRESFQRKLESVRRKLQSTLDDKVPPEPAARDNLEAPHLGTEDWEQGADPDAMDEIVRQVEALTQPSKDGDSIQHSRASDQQKPRSDLDNTVLFEPDVQVEPEGRLPLDTGLETDASPVAVNQFREGDWEDRTLTSYIDETDLKESPARRRSQGQWRFSSNDDWEEDAIAGDSVSKRSSFMWGVLGAISVLLLFSAVWLQFFDENGALSRFFADTATKIESALLFAWQGAKGDASPEATAKPPLPSSETNAPEPANPASPGQNSVDDAWTLKTGAMVQFDSNSYVIGPEYKKLLDRVAAYLEHHPEQHVSLLGYSDNIGDKSYNLHISRYRALVVKYYLIGKGVSAERMQILGKGEGSPVGSNDSPKGRQHNRRVEIKLKPLPPKHQPDIQSEDLVKKKGT